MWPSFIAQKVTQRGVTDNNTLRSITQVYIFAGPGIRIYGDLRDSERVIIQPGKARIYEASLRFRKGLLSGQGKPDMGEFRARAGIPISFTTSTNGQAIQTS